MSVHSSPAASRLHCVCGCESLRSDAVGWPLSPPHAYSPSAQPSRNAGVPALCQGAGKPTALFFLLPEPVRVHAPWGQGGQAPAHPHGAYRPGHHHLCLRGQVPEDPAGGRHPGGMWLLALCTAPWEGAGG